MMGSVHVFFTALICLLTLLNNVGVSGFDLNSRQLTISDIPACGITCLLSKVPDSECGFTDTECQCRSKSLARELTACMLANCTMEESLETSKVQADLCDFSNESKTHEVVLYTGIVYSIAFAFVFLRIVGKIAAKRITYDDYIVVSAILITAIPLGCVLRMCEIGFGDHLWNLENGQLRDNLLLFLVAWSTYIVVLALIKISLVTFYLEIFNSRAFRITAWITLTYLVINTLVLYLLTLFNCVPLKAFWDRDVKGRCMDINALAYSASGCAIAQDVILLIIPLIFIRKLNMRLYRKIAVGCMFSIGTFGCIASILRLRSLLSFKASLDPTWDYVSITVWTELELAAAFACVSLPSIRLLFMMIIPQRVKEFLSNVTHPSRSAPTPNQNSQESKSSSKRHQRKHSPWMSISQGTEEGSLGSGRFGSGLWTTNSRSQIRSQSQRLESGSGMHPQDVELGLSPTRSPYEKQLQEPVQLQDFTSTSSSSRHFCKSCCERPDAITALPRVEFPVDDNPFETDLPPPRDTHKRKNSIWRPDCG